MLFHNVTPDFSITKLTLGLAAVIDGRGVNACIVCDTPAARMNSSLSSVLVLPRALGFCGKFKKFLVEKFSKLVHKRHQNSINNWTYFKQLFRQL
jgi:hypothetical protein